MDRTGVAAVIAMKKKTSGLTEELCTTRNFEVFSLPYDVKLGHQFTFESPHETTRLREMLHILEDDEERFK